MKLAIRIFAMTIAVTGLVSSSYAPTPSRAIPGQFATVSLGAGPFSLPVPFCAPGVPGCTPR